MRKIIAALIVALSLAAPLSASWERNVMWGRSLGYAVHTPNAETTLDDTPDEGVALPAGTRTITFTVENNPIRVLFGSTATTGTRGLLLDAGTYTIPNDPKMIAAMRFIDSSAGASKVTVEFYGDTQQ